MTDKKRQSHLAAIHIAQKALGLSTDDATALKLAVTGQASASTMTAPQRAKYLAHLGGLAKKQPKAMQAPAQRSVDDYRAERWGKARAIWGVLADAGAVEHNSDAALMAYVKRQTHMDAWRFLNTWQINTVIESLKAWLARVTPSADAKSA